MDDLRRLALDLEYYALQSLKIESKTAQLVPFAFYPVQKDFHDAIEAEKLRKRQKGDKSKTKALVLKSRRHGLSSYVSSRFFWKIVGSPNTRAAIVAHKSESTNTIFEMVKTFYNNLPVELRPERQNCNTKSLIFDNDKGTGLRSRFDVATAGGHGVLASSAAHYVHCSEFALWPEQEDTLGTIIPIIPNSYDDSELIVESTGRVIGDHFYNLWMDGEGWLKKFYAWFRDPANVLAFVSEKDREEFGASLNQFEREIRDTYELALEQLFWRRYTINTDYNRNELLFNREFPSTPDQAFIASGSCYFDVEICKLKYDYLMKRRLGTKGTFRQRGDGYEFYETQHGEWMLYEPPVKNHQYLLAADIADGGGDFTRYSILDRYTGKQVASFASDVWRAHDVSQLVAAGRYYKGIEKECCEAVERNNHGGTVLAQLSAAGYTNIYLGPSNIIDGTGVRKPGFLTTGVSKPIIIDNLDGVLRTDSIEFRDIDFWAECMSFVRTTSGLEASPGCHDDAVMANAILCQVHKELPIKYPNRGHENDRHLKIENVHHRKRSSISGY